jgi:hypothetical protein
MAFPTTITPLARPHGIGAPSIEEAQAHRFRTGSALTGQTVSLTFEPLTQAQVGDLMAHWSGARLEGVFALPPSTVWVGRSSPPAVTLWRFTSIPTFRRLPGGYYDVTGMDLAAMA